MNKKGQEISFGGLAMGVAMAFFVFVLRGKMLNPMLENMPSTSQKYFWMISTYVVCFIAGYFLWVLKFQE